MPADDHSAAAGRTGSDLNPADLWWTSVVIAAHNEESVIGRCLDALLSGAERDEFDVTVVANGCTDATAAVAARRAGVRVVTLDTASKPAALNAGDGVASGLPAAVPRRRCRSHR